MTNSSMLAEAEKVYQVLIKGRIIERETAERRLTACASPALGQRRDRLGGVIDEHALAA